MCIQLHMYKYIDHSLRIRKHNNITRADQGQRIFEQQSETETNRKILKDTSNQCVTQIHTYNLSNCSHMKQANHA